MIPFLVNARVLACVKGVIEADAEKKQLAMDYYQLVILDPDGFDKSPNMSIKVNVVERLKLLDPINFRKYSESALCQLSCVLNWRQGKLSVQVLDIKANKE